MKTPVIAGCDEVLEFSRWEIKKQAEKWSILADVKLEIKVEFEDGILAIWNSKSKHKSGRF